MSESVNRALASCLLAFASVACGPSVRDEEPLSVGQSSYGQTTDGLRHNCRPLTDVRELLTDGELRSLPLAEKFSPPVLDEEDVIVNHLTGKEIGPSSYSVTNNFGDDVSPTMRGHLGIDYDDVHGWLASDPQREDARYPIRAAADGVVVYAGYVCEDNTVVRPPTVALLPSKAWGIVVRILHRTKDDAGEDRYYLSTYAHLEGPEDPLRGQEKLAVKEGDRVTRRQVIASIGPTKEQCGDIPWKTHLHHEIRLVDPFSDDDTERRVMNDQGSGYNGTVGWQGRYLDPAAFYAGYGYSAASGPLAVNYPVGTVVYRVRWWEPGMGRDYYVVCSAGTLCHVADEAAFYANRFYQEWTGRWGYAAEVSSSAMNCYAQGPSVTGGPTMRAISCGDGTYLSLNGAGQSVRRKVSDTASHRRILLHSWGFRTDEVTAGGSDCSLPAGEALTLRDGTIIEMASDNDFYVVTNGGMAQRLRRDTFLGMGYPFAAVIQVPDGSVPFLVKGMDTTDREFTPEDAALCLNRPGGGGSAETGTDTGTPTGAVPSGPCEWHSQRCPADLAFREVCTMNFEENVAVGTEWFRVPCPSGQRCDPSHGGCVSAPPAEPAASGPSGGPLPPHSIFCERTAWGVTATVTGPVLDGNALMETPSGPVSLALGADGLGWPSSTSTPWSGDSAAHALTVPSGVSSFNLFLAGSSATGDSWLRLAPNAGAPWRAFGACRTGTYEIEVLPEGEEEPAPETAEPAAPGTAGGEPPAEDPPPDHPVQDGAHTVRCEARGDGSTLVTVTGPLLDGLSLMEAPSSPAALALGADGLGWPSQASVPWLGDPAAHELVLPPGVASFNLYVVDADDPARDSWLRLYAADGSPWTVAGDCEMGAGLVLVL